MSVLALLPISAARAITCNLYSKVNKTLKMIRLITSMGQVPFYKKKNYIVFDN